MSEKMPWDDSPNFLQWLCNNIRNWDHFARGLNSLDFEELKTLFAKAVQFGREQEKQETSGKLSRLRSAHVHIEQELNVLRFREMNLDNIAEYVDSNQRLRSHLSKSIAREHEMEKEIESLQADKRELVEALDYICGLSNALNAAVNTANASIDKHEEKQ